MTASTKYEPKSIQVTAIREVTRFDLSLTARQAYALYYAIDEVLNMARLGVVGNRINAPQAEPLFDLYDSLYARGVID